MQRVRVLVVIANHSPSIGCFEEGVERVGVDEGGFAALEFDRFGLPAQ